MNPLLSYSCSRIAKGTPPLTAEGITELSEHVPGWTVPPSLASMQRTFRFSDYWRTMAFVNAVAFIAHTEDHHPELSVHYDRCIVRWRTHDVGGLSENDFICAAKVDALYGRLANKP